VINSVQSDPFSSIHTAIQADDAVRIANFFKDMTPSAQALLLMQSGHQDMGVIGTLPYLAVGASSDVFLALVKHLPETFYLEVFSVLTDGDTPLTKALAWSRTDKVIALLTSISDKNVFDALLDTQDGEGNTLASLLEAKGLLEDIKQQREEAFPEEVTCNFWFM